MQYLWQHLQETDKPIVLYGMGNGADRILCRLEALGIKASGVFASDDFARDHFFRGFPVTTYEQAKDKFGNMIVLLAFGTQLPEVMERIKRIASEQELYVPDMPVCGDEHFTPEYAETHRPELDTVRGFLTDEASVKVFDNIIKYRLSGNIDYLTACESDTDEVYKILNLGDSESYLDLGAYNGDTVAEFNSHVCSYKGIIAVEPDKKSFRKLLGSTAGLSNFRALNIGVSGGETEIPFSSGSGRGSASGKGKTERMIPAASIDMIIGADRVSFIKMDVEGQERAAVSGGMETIKRCRPKMRVSCYHRTEDIFDLPMLIKSLMPDYKVYLRRRPYFPAWDTEFIFI